MTPIKSIRAYCVNHCMCGQAKEVRLCPCVKCELWPYRMGKRPTTPGSGETEENPDVAHDFEEQNEDSRGAS